jgi:hypothetical protein
MRTRRANIDLIRVGDTVIHNGHQRTVTASIMGNGFCGRTLWGDSYRMGTTTVTVVDFTPAKKDKKYIYHG